MAHQIRKKYLHPEIISYFDDQIFATESALSTEQARAEAQEALIRGEFAAADFLILQESKQYTDSHAEQEATERSQEISSAIALEQQSRELLGTTLRSEFASADQLILSEAKSYTDSEIAAIPQVDLTPYETILASEQKLQEAKDYADGKFNDAQTLISQVSSDLQSEISRATLAEQGLDSRISSLETRADGPQFDNEKITVESELSFIELSREVSKIMSAAIGRVAIHEGEDYDVLVVNGKTRLVWKNSMVNPLGVEKIESGQTVFVVYSYVD